MPSRLGCIEARDRFASPTRSVADLITPVVSLMAAVLVSIIVATLHPGSEASAAPSAPEPAKDLQNTAPFARWNSIMHADIERNAPRANSYRGAA
jgi:hypothetical protein